MRRRIDHVPTEQVLRQASQILLLAVPVVALADFDTRGDDGDGGFLALHGAGLGDFALAERVGDQVFLQLRFDVLAALVGGAAVDAIFARAAFGDGAGEAVETERGDDAAGPEHEASAGGGDGVDEVFVQRVDEEDAVDVFDFAAGEDAAVDAAYAG